MQWDTGFRKTTQKHIFWLDIVTSLGRSFGTMKQEEVDQES